MEANITPLAILSEEGMRAHMDMLKRLDLLREEHDMPKDLFRALVAMGALIDRTIQADTYRKHNA